MMDWNPFRFFRDKEPKIKIVRKIIRCPDCDTGLAFIRAVTVETPEQTVTEENNICMCCSLELTLRRRKCLKV